VLEDRVTNQTIKDYEKNLNIGPSGLSGWLILIAIGLVITPIAAIYMITEYNLPIFNDIETWREFTNPNSANYLPLFSFLVYFELIGNTIILLFSILFLYLFFRKKRLFPRIYFWFLIGNLLFVFIDEILVNSMVVLDEFPYRETLRQALPSAIWLRYLVVSKRVKNTFVN
jgi:ABC-type multidrug transport system permease subunit